MKLELGQRFRYWENDVVAEVISFRGINIELKVVQAAPQNSWGFTLGRIFISSEMSYGSDDTGCWQYLEGQDRPR